MRYSRRLFIPLFLIFIIFIFPISLRCEKKEIIRKIEVDLIKDLKKMQKFIKLGISKFAKKIIRDPFTIEFLQHLYSDNEYILDEFELNSDSSPLFYNAPCLIVNYVWKDSGMTGDIFAQYHCIIAQTYMMLQAEALALGLGSCILGYASESNDIIKKYVKIPKNHKIYVVFCLGYPKYQYPKKIQRNLPNVIWSE